jgi:hypothetical protein
MSKNPITTVRAREIAPETLRRAEAGRGEAAERAVDITGGIPSEVYQRWMRDEETDLTPEEYWAAEIAGATATDAESARLRD